jgi:hypothetical protein
VMSSMRLVGNALVVDRSVDRADRRNPSPDRNSAAMAQVVTFSLTEVST